jgi:hypothetical protein
MKHAATAAAAALAAASLFAAPGVSAAAGDDILQQARDRAEIEDLMWRYSRAVDTLNADAYVQVFTPDGSFGAVKGRAALHKMIDDLKTGFAERAAKGEKQAGMYHLETNEHLEFEDRDHARIHYYWITAFGGGPADGPVRIAAVGHGYDNLVRVDGHWLIHDRNVAPKDD